MVLVMSVVAGFGGQPFNPIALDKVRTLRSENPDLLLQIDGGLQADNIGAARQAGADLFVVGSAVFSQNDYAAAISQMDEAIAAAEQSTEASR
jgi:ribulose-phosphate 3-epimerase